MRPIPMLPLPPGATADQKLAWCVTMINEIARASRESDPNVYADEYTISDLTPARTLSADAGAIADLAAAKAAIEDTRAVLLSFIQDHKTRGSKRT